MGKKPSAGNRVIVCNTGPLFDGEDVRHRKLVDWGRVCAEKGREALVSSVLDVRLDVGVLRRRVRELLSDELSAIDALVREVLK